MGTLKRKIRSSLLSFVIFLALINLAHAADEAIDQQKNQPLKLKEKHKENPNSKGIMDTWIPVNHALEPFAPESWVFLSYGGYFRSTRDRDGELADGRVGFGYYFIEKLAVFLELHAVGITGDEVRTSGYGLSSWLRWHVFHNDLWSFYFEGGGGVMLIEKEFPRGGTNTNFTLQRGIGGTLLLIERVHLLAGVRDFHISNGDIIAGDDRNPAFDSFGGYLGYLLRF